MRFYILLSLMLCALASGLAAPGKPPIPRRAKVVYVVDLRRQPLERQLLAVSLQGALNASMKTPFVYMRLMDNDPRWLEYILTYGYKSQVEMSVDDLLEKFRGYVAGQILYDPAKPHTVSLATILCGLDGGIMSAKDLGIKTLYDLRTDTRFADPERAYRWALDELLPRCRQDMVAVLDSGLPHIRDYLIAEQIFTVDLDPLNSPQDIALLRQLFGKLAPSATVLGWASGKYAGPGQDGVTVENAFLTLLSEYGHHLAASDFIPNLSYHRAFRARARTRSHLTPLRYDPQTVYVTFLFSDGDNMQFDYNRMLDLWRDSARGKIPLGWTVAPALSRVAPALLAKYAQDARASKSDDLVMGPSGYGYCNPARLAKPEPFFALTRQAAAATGIRAATVIDYEPEARLRDTLQKMGVETGLEGVFLIRQGIEGVFGSLAVADEDIRFGPQSPEEMARQIEGLGASRPFIFVYVDAWSRAPQDVLQAAQALPDRFKVVGPYDFLRLMKARAKK
ncbi:MAG: hypothetical protein IT210_15740 [Armatimonadetes bacterium]|nr:hypothetical protein [Armatimonadota bacterium]